MHPLKLSTNVFCGGFPSWVKCNFTPAFCAQKYVTVHHEGGEDLIDESLKTLEAEHAERFVRAHRSLLVSIRHIASLDKDEAGRPGLRLRGTDERLVVSRRHAADIKRKLRAR
jgi:two-component system response regulator AlgR